ncbi:ThiF family adenylyltransferase [Microbacterium sp. WHRI 7836]|uniref:ThiF family adenylyltransferase n=1 Tax=Microbacterium sp. WHRI 7836 TaxID=3162563 RepID=UPI0032EF2A22
MSTSPFAADSSIRQLLEEDYCLTVDSNHLLVEHIPYVTPAREVAYGRLALPVTFSGDDIVQDATGSHVIWFIGEQPCDENGKPIEGATPSPHAVTADLTAEFMISSKPRRIEAFDTMHEKVRSYARVLSHPARALDPTVTATPGAGWSEVPDDLPFVYRDTGTARAGLADMNARFRGQKVAIIGLGGTGSYILDQVAKTWVDSIDLFDGDVFDNHNAFRAPGAATLDELAQRPNKADYFAGRYAHMHTGINAHPTFVTADRLDVLAGFTFVFMAAADADDKPQILAWLRERSVPVIEVGMGIQDEGGRLSGLLTIVNHFPGLPISPAASSAGGVNEYDRNIQVADLNALNATLAVLEWKKYLGYYASAGVTTESIYKIFTGDIRVGAELDTDFGTDDGPDADAAPSEEAA